MLLRNGPLWVTRDFLGHSDSSLTVFLDSKQVKVFGVLAEALEVRSGSGTISLA